MAWSDDGKFVKIEQRPQDRPSLWHWIRSSINWCPSATSSIYRQKDNLLSKEVRVEFLLTKFCNRTFRTQVYQKHIKFTSTFVASCRVNINERQTLFTKISSKDPTFMHLDNREKFIFLMSCKDRQILTWFGKFLHKSFITRNMKIGRVFRHNMQVPPDDQLKTFVFIDWRCLYFALPCRWYDIDISKDILHVP